MIRACGFGSGIFLLMRKSLQNLLCMPYLRCQLATIRNGLQVSPQITSICIFSAKDKFKLLRKKVFKGHLVAGYACQPAFSPDGSYLVSGDSEGKLCIWDFKSTKMYSKFKAHDEVVINCAWLPHESSKVITCGWDGILKLWD